MNLRMFNTLLKFLLCLFAGGFLRIAIRPSTAQLETQAVAAWNQGDVSRAELLARQALGRSPYADDARVVLAQVAARDNRPLLQIALLLSVPLDEPTAISSRFRAGKIAFQNGYAAITEQAWQQTIELKPGHIQALDGLIMLSTVRLDRERVLKLSFERDRLQAPQITPGPSTLTAEALERQAFDLESLLSQFVRKDPSDIASRIGWARCLIIQRRTLEAVKCLSGQALTDEGQTILAYAWSALGEFEKAKAALPRLSSVDASGDYWLTSGSIALGEGRIADALDSLSRAVDKRPLNREIRARYCEALREAGDTESAEKHSNALRILQEIETLATASNKKWSQEKIDTLIDLCVQIGADSYVTSLKGFRESLEAEH